MAVDYTLQILHASDFEAGTAAADRAPQFAAIVDWLEDLAPNSITLSSGDNFIPSPFLAAQGDPSLREPLQAAMAELLGVPAEELTGLREGLARIDMAILSAIGVEASVLGNHEFDLGTTVLADAINFTAAFDAGPAGVTWTGPFFPYLSANLDFSGDAALRGLFTEELLPASAYAITAEDLRDPDALADAAAAPRIAPWTTIEEGGETIGVIGATTQMLEQISSTGGVRVMDPDGGSDGGGVDDMAALAAILQPYVDAMTDQGINKIVLLSHLQQYQFELDLAEHLSGVDVIVSGGSHALFADDGTPLRPDDVPAESYPVFRTGADGNPVVVVSTPSEYSYVGRLTVGFDADGVVLPEATDTPDSRPYAATDEVVAELWGNEDPYAPGTRGALVRDLTEAVQQVITAKDSNVFGFTEVFLEGRRAAVRTEQTNFGDLSADANLAYARQVDPTVEVSIKNGGGIRAEIGAYSPDPTNPVPLPPQENPSAGKPEGAVSQLDIENALRFNNGLTLVTVTPEGLREILEAAVSGVAPGATPGAFPQISGISFSFDPALPAGQRIQSLAIVDEEGQPTEVLVQDGDVVGDPSRGIRVVTLNFLADGGDGYPFPDFIADRVDLFDENDTSFDAVGREQRALADYMAERHGTPDEAYAEAETPPELDTRLQNLAVREDTVLEGAPEVPPGTDTPPVDWDALAAEVTANYEATGYWFL